MKSLGRTLTLLCAAMIGAMSCFAQAGKPSDAPPPPPAVEYDPKAWKEFSSPEGGFSVLLVGTPQVATMEVDSKPDNLSYRTFGLQTGVGMYLITYNDLSIYSENPKLINLGLDAQRDQMLRENAEMKLLSEKEITFNGTPAREWLVQHGDMIIRQRAILVKERMYHMALVTNTRVAFKTGRPSADTSEWTDFYKATGSKFLDSFKTLPREASLTARLLKQSDEKKKMPYGDPQGRTADTEGAVDKMLKGLPAGSVVVGQCTTKYCKRVSGAVAEFEIVENPAPGYPPIAKAARAQGKVVVKLIADEEGNVIAAQALSGHPLLQSSAVMAARKIRTSPVMMNGAPVKVSGIIVYTFVLQ